MAVLTPQQIVRRERVEGLVALVAPLLDLVLAVGERVSRLAGAEDEYYPIRSPGEALPLEAAPPAEPPADA
jgi:hypothetical protein